MTDLLQSLLFGFTSQYGGLNNTNATIDSNNTTITSNVNANANKTTTIIVFIIVIILLGIGVYYFSKSKDQSTVPTTSTPTTSTPTTSTPTTPTPSTSNTTTNNYDYLKCETTNVTNMPKDCLKKMWFDQGCGETNIPSDFFSQQDVDRDMKNDKGEPTTYNELYENQKKMMLSYNYGKEMCYGTDKSKWPKSACNKYNNDSKNIDIDCLSELYSSKCPNFDKTKLHSSWIEKSKDYPLEYLQGNLLFFQPDNCHLLYEPMPNQ
jgi:hypothetical protein